MHKTNDNKCDDVVDLSEANLVSKQVVVFDFDGTVLNGSSPTLLVNYLGKRGMLTFRTLLCILGWAIAYKLRLPQSEAWVRGLVFSAFEGEPKEEVDKFLREFFDSIIAPRIRPRAKQAMQSYCDMGAAVILVSASFEPVIIRATEILPAVGQFSTRMKVGEDGTYTRQVVGRPVEGEEKLSAISRWCDRNIGKGKWELACAYGDHHSDRSMLEAAKHPFVVNPDRPLKRIAKARNWHIVFW